MDREARRAWDTDGDAFETACMDRCGAPGCSSDGRFGIPRRSSGDFSLASASAPSLLPLPPDPFAAAVDGGALALAALPSPRDDFQSDSALTLPLPPGDELVDFIATELEQQRARITAVSAGIKRLEHTVATSNCEMVALAIEQREKVDQSALFIRQLEAEVAHGAGLRREEARLRDGKLETSIGALRRDLEGSLKALERTLEVRMREMEDKLDKVVVGVVIENQTLRAENMELRSALQQAAVAANSNRKTLRVLTDEILKLKRQVVRPPPSCEGPHSASDRLERGIALALRVASSASHLER